ncbi:helix-turn-helix domain-containing protein [Pantoea cypripedii]|uniref:OmpR/PhoB-type domain-containing protein n=1 Tax=Pantoea cypripedii TaxID=55209 RepID=A0A6B9GEL3_PANCY|nr:helix-turn-helix domain-containing protein [Pantoea cypripedii]QGY31949.1 hypothetical protein CUN67_20960 [Pantoea cypripedii]
MTKMEFSYYYLLAQHKGRIVPADLVIEHIWPGREAVTSQNNLSQLTFKVKKKILEADGEVILRSSLKEGCMLSHSRRTLTLFIKSRLMSRICRLAILKKMH